MERERTLISSFLLDVVAGSAAGITSTFVGHPLDTMKVSYFIIHIKGSNPN